MKTPRFIFRKERKVTENNDMSNDDNMSDPQRRRTFIKRLCYGIVPSGITIGALKLFNINLFNLERKAVTSDPDFNELAKYSVLRDGSLVPQFFKGRAPITDYSSKETVGFEIVNSDWRYPFWSIAFVRDGFAYCDFAVGCEQDIGKKYEITGKRLPPGVTVPTGVPLQAPVPGEVFHGPSHVTRT